MYWRVTEKTVASRLPAALAYKLIRRALSTRSVAPSARPGTAHSTAPPPTGCVIRLGLP
eukprot:COSAG06_NODE_55817_length_287_cov_9.468085_1_plen_58_part_10